MENLVQAVLRLEELGDKNNATGHDRGGRVWIDVTVRGVKAQSQVWYSGDYAIAEKIHSGELMINDQSEVVPGERFSKGPSDVPTMAQMVHEASQAPSVFESSKAPTEGPTEFEVFTGQRNPRPHW